LTFRNVLSDTVLVFCGYFVLSRSGSEQL